VSDNPEKFGPSSQAIVVVPGLNAVDIMDQIKVNLNDFNVIKTTSPFDGQTMWIEIFPLCVSKGKSAAWLAQTLGIDRKHTVAVGNDYNDEDLLEWTGNAFVVENGPDDLKQRFSVVSSNNNDGVSDAIKSGFHL
jgi:hydroxymethylpyrimidine pyrophosphatase-like HAD family hydrolase